MKQLFRSGFLLVSWMLVPALSASAATPAGTARKHELAGNTTLFALFEDNAEFSLEGTYRRLLVPEKLLQAGIRLVGAREKNAEVIFSNGTDVVRGALLLGPRLNFHPQRDLLRAWFGELDLGAALESRSGVGGTDSSVDFAFSIEGGKRFRLAENVAWTPTLQLFQVMGSDLQFRLTPFALSLFL